MLTGRAWAVVGASALLWLASRFVGAPDLHMVSVALLAVVPISALVMRITRHDLAATRRLSTPRAAPGTRVRVDLELHNRARRGTSLLLLEDRLPSTLGGAARAAIGEVPPGGRRTVSYQLTARHRGRYRVGPLVAWVTDPFDLVRQRIEFADRQDLIVYPEVEELGPVAPAAPVGTIGESSTRQLFRSGDDFYTMRHYEIGDDLRRIHWPSVARTGKLMIRQDEAVRRAHAALLLDTRERALGEHPAAFEKAVSAAASIGAHHLRAGFSLRLALPDQPMRLVEREDFLELLAVVRPSPTAALTPALRQFGALAGAGASLVVVTNLPGPEEIAALSPVGAGYPSRLAVLLHRTEPEELPIKPRWEADRRATVARTSLTRAGWEVLLLSPRGRLSETWQQRTKRSARHAAASSTSR